MVAPSGLTFDCKPHSYSVLLKSFGDQQIDQTQKLEDFLSRLEEERLKIDAFKRELPLCMQLLTNAVEASRQQLHACQANQGSRPVLEEFIPLKNSGSENSEKSQNISDKANWMTSAQLWSQAGNETKPLSTITSPKETNISFDVSSKSALDTKQRNGRAFFLFPKDRNSSPVSTLQPLPELALASGNKDVEDKKCLDTENDCQRREKPSKVENGGTFGEQGKGGSCNETEGQTTNNNASTSQPHRKARRCWSPDLHRRFVNALQMLGGSQVATPKQIRELSLVFPFLSLSLLFDLKNSIALLWLTIFAEHMMIQLGEGCLATSLGDQFLFDRGVRTKTEGSKRVPGPANLSWQLKYAKADNLKGLGRVVHG